jgi:hypothetical protein
MSNPEFMVIVDGKNLDTLTATQAAEALAPELAALGYVIKKPDVTTDPIKEPPAEVKPQPSVAQLDHQFVGTQKDTGNPMFLVQFSGQQRLLEDHSGGRLEKFSVCGGEIAINLQPGVRLPSIPWTQGWGFNTPPDFVCPPDYIEGWFLDKNGKPDRKFFAWKYYQEPTQPESTTSDVTPVILSHHEPFGR